MADNQGPRLTIFGHLFTLLFIVGLLALGWWVIWGRSPTPTPPSQVPMSTPAAAAHVDPRPQGLIAPAEAPPRLDPPGAYRLKDGVLDIDISEYAGYAGIIVANQGLAPDPASPLAQAMGLPVRLVVGEGEKWGEVNAGRYAASATTVDVLAVLGRQYRVTVPLQLAFSRGADGIVVAKDIPTVNALRGRTVAVSPWNESEFLLRYLAGEAGIAVQQLADLAARPDPKAIGVVYGEDIDQVADLFAAELGAGHRRLAGFVGWAPKTDAVIAASQGRARMLVTNRNLLVVADVLAVNQGWAEANPQAVRGMVRAILEGNRICRREPQRALPLLEKAYGWDAAQARTELARIHFSNLPENLAFFQGTIDSAGSFGGIYQSAVLAYGQLLKDPVDGDRFVDLKPLSELHSAGAFADEQVQIAPIRAGSGPALEGPLLSKNIRFLFEANSANLDAAAPQNAEYLKAIKGYLQVSPGSTVLLRGHVDPSRIPELRQSGGESAVRSFALKAMELSKNRAAAVRQALVSQAHVDPARIETVGRGWEEPIPEAAAEENRRVEVQWFTLE
jgi:NitT/TauT family transport system substrate-binding protein